MGSFSPNRYWVQRELAVGWLGWFGFELVQCATHESLISNRDHSREAASTPGWLRPGSRGSCRRPKIVLSGLDA
jgi:hypothetical protein